MNYNLVLLQKSFDMLKHLQTILNNLPGYLIFITNRCNFRCKFCYYSRDTKGKKSKWLTIDEIENFWTKNIIQISMAGGEPFLRKILMKSLRFLLKIQM